jgi:hypothetical protein
MGARKEAVAEEQTIDESCIRNAVQILDPKIHAPSTLQP